MSGDTDQQQMTVSSRLMDNYLGDRDFEKKELEKKRRAERLAALPDRDKGIVFWEDWCRDEGYDGTTLTWEAFGRYIHEFVIPMEEAVNQRARQDKKTSPLPGIRAFTEPVLRLIGKSLEMKDQVQAAAAASRPSLSSFPIPRQGTQSRPAITLTTTTATTTVVRSQKPVLSAHSTIPPHPRTQAGSSTSSANSSSALESSSQMSLNSFSTSGTAQLGSSRTNLQPDRASNYSAGTINTTISGKDKNNNNNNESSSGGPHRSDIGYNSGASSSNSAGHDMYSRFKAQEFELMKIGGHRPRHTPAAKPLHMLSEDVKTILDVLQEWRFGLGGKPALQDLNRKYFGRWRSPTDTSRYQARAVIVRCYVDLVVEGGQSDEAAIRLLQEYLGTNSFITLHAKLLKLRWSGEFYRYFTGSERSGRVDAVKVKPKAIARVEPHDRIISRDRRNHGGQFDDDEEDEEDEEDDDPEPPLIRRTMAERKALEKADAELRQIPYPKPPIQNDIPFPFPVRELHAVGDIWQEWTVGWEGAPSIESLLQIHGDLWTVEPYKSEHYTTFYIKDRIVSVIHLAVSTAAVGSVEEAISYLEEFRKQKKITSFCSSEIFRIILVEWGIGRKKKGVVGRYGHG